MAQPRQKMAAQDAVSQTCHKEVQFA